MRLSASSGDNQVIAMLNGFNYKWIDITNWEFARINQITHKLASEGWELDDVVEDSTEGITTGRSDGSISLRFRRQAAA